MNISDHATHHIINYLFDGDNANTLGAIESIIDEMPDPNTGISGLAVDLEDYFKLQQSPAQDGSLKSLFYRLCIKNVDWLKVAGKLIDHFETKEILAQKEAK